MSCAASLPMNLIECSRIESFLDINPLLAKLFILVLSSFPVIPWSLQIASIVARNPMPARVKAPSRYALHVS